MGAPSPYRSATDLAEYAYCPRARYYRERYGEPPRTPAARAGTLYHERKLRAVRRRHDRPGLSAGIVVAGAVLLAVALLVLVR